MKLLLLASALIASNYVYQFFSGMNWELALDRSYFQAVALLCVWVNK